MQDLEVTVSKLGKRNPALTKPALTRAKEVRISARSIQTMRTIQTRMQMKSS